MSEREEGGGRREEDDRREGAEPGEATGAGESLSALRPPPTSLSRRQALTVLGAAPLALLQQQGPTQGRSQPQQQAPKVPHATPNQPAGEQPQPPNNRPRSRFFTARERRIAGVLADDIIPRDGRSGSATDAGVLDYIDFHMSVPETSDEARVAMRGGLRWVDVESRKRFGVGYDRAREAQRHQILDDIAGPPAQAKPEMRAGATFFSNFRNQVGAGFFSSAMGWKDLQYMGNTFVPSWNGCPERALRKLNVSYDLMNTRVKSQAQG